MPGIKELLKTKFTGQYQTTVSLIYLEGYKQADRPQTVLCNSNNIMPAIELLRSISFRTLAAIRGDGIDIVNIISGYRLDILLITDCILNTCGTVQGVFPVLATKDIIKPAIRPLPNSKWIRPDVKTQHQEKYNDQKAIYNSMTTQE